MILVDRAALSKARIEGRIAVAPVTRSGSSIQSGARSCEPRQIIRCDHGAGGDSDRIGSAERTPPISETGFDGKPDDGSDAREMQRKQSHEEHFQLGHPILHDCRKASNERAKRARNGVDSSNGTMQPSVLSHLK